MDCIPGFALNDASIEEAEATAMDKGGCVTKALAMDGGVLSADGQTPLEALWHVAFPGKRFAGAESQEWIRLGFQTEAPEKDLRAAGLDGLRQLRHFCQSSGACPLHLVLASQTSFPLAVASLNVSLLLMQFFALCATSGGCGALEPCSDATMRSAVRLQRSLPLGVSILDIIHEHLTRWLFDRWRECECVASAHRPVLFEFPMLLRATGRHLERSIARLPPVWSLSAVCTGLRNDTRLPAEGDTAACNFRGRGRGKAHGKER